MSPEEEGWIKLAKNNLLTPTYAAPQTAQTSVCSTIKPIQSEEEFWIQKASTSRSSPKLSEFFWSPPPPPDSPPPPSPHERYRKRSSILTFCEERERFRIKNTPKSIAEDDTEVKPSDGETTTTSIITTTKNGSPNSSIEVIVGEPDPLTGAVKIVINVNSNRNMCNKL